MAYICKVEKGQVVNNSLKQDATTKTGQNPTFDMPYIVDQNRLAEDMNADRLPCPITRRKCIGSLLFSFVLLLTMVFSGGLLQAQIPKAIINEWSQGNGAQKEWVEILVVENNLNMQNWELVDENNMRVVFGAAFNNLPSGTLILVYNPSQKNNDLQGAEFDFGNVNPTSNPCRFNFLPNHTPVTGDFLQVNWDNLLAFADGNNTDNPRLLDATRNVIHDWDRGNNAAFTSGGKRPGGNQSTAFTGNTLGSYTNLASWTTTAWDQATPGLPNNAANKRVIDSLKTTSGILCVEFASLTSSAKEGTTLHRINILSQYPASRAATLQFSFGGSATQGIDYGNLSNQLTINPNDNNLWLEFNLLTDCDNNENEDIVLELLPNAAYQIATHDPLTNLPRNPQRNIHTLRIQDSILNYEIDITADPRSICPPNTTTNLTPRFVSGTEPANMVWNWRHGANTKNVTVAPVAPSEWFYLTATTPDLPGCEFKDSIEILVGSANIVLVADKSTVCPGETVNLTASGGDAGTYVWGNQVGLTPNATNERLATYSSATTGNSMVTVQGSYDGCVGFDTLYVTIAEPELTLSSDVEVCAGEMFTANIVSYKSMATLPAGAQVAWTSASVSLTPQQAAATTFDLTLAEAGTYNLDATVTEGVCSVTKTLQVQVLPAPTMPTPQGPAYFCKDEAFVLTLDTTGLQNFSYEIEPSEAGLTNIVASVVGSDYQFSAVGTDVSQTYTVRFRAESSRFPNCPADTTFTIAGNSISVEGINSPGLMLCAGVAHQYKINGLPTGAVPYIVITPNTGLTEVLSSDTLSLTGTVPGSYEVVVSVTSGGCTSQDTLGITVYPMPDVDLVIAPDGPQGPFCAGMSIKFTASGADSYRWEPANLLDTPSATETAFFTLNANTTITVFGTAAASNNLCSSSAEMSITIMPAPDLSSLAKNVSACKDSETTLGEGLTPDPNTTFIWAPGTGLDNANNAQPKLTPTDVGTFTYTLTTTIGNCSNTADVTVVVNEPPVVTITPDQPNKIKVGTPFNFVAGGADTFEWTPSGNITGNLNTETINVSHSEAGDYSYTVTGTNTATSCTAQATVTIKVEDISSVNIITPNGDGINDVFFFDADPNLFVSVETSIFDRSGTRLHETNVIGESGGWKGTTKGGNDVPAGIYHYVLKLKRKDGKAFEKAGTITVIR